MLSTKLATWIANNQPNFGSAYESLFATTVFSLIPELRVEDLRTQYPFFDSDGKQRYCDFVIQEGRSIRIAIEVDGFDKTGVGHGMSHDEFVQWQRRQASLTAQGWYVLRFANRDVQNEPERCAKDISQLLGRLRCSEQEQYSESMLASPIQDSSQLMFPERTRRPSRENSTQDSHQLAHSEQEVSWKRSPIGAEHTVSGKNSRKSLTDLRKVAVFYACLATVGLFIFLIWKSKGEESGEALVRRPLEYFESDKSLSAESPFLRGEVGIGADRIEEVLEPSVVHAEIIAARRRYQLLHSAPKSEPTLAVPVAERRDSRAFYASVGRGEIGIGADRIEEVMTDEEWLAEHHAARRRYAEIQRSGLIRSTVESTDAASRGISCKNPISWRMSLNHIGNMVAVEGPVVRVTHREDIQGQPTWIELGHPYPNPARLVLVAWGQNKVALADQTMIGTTVCVTGKIEAYKGTLQIAVTNPGQIRAIY